MSANIPDVQFSLEEYSKHHSAVFNSLRRQIKKNAPMFAFGAPTPQIVMLLFKIYHENILRNLSSTLDRKQNATDTKPKIDVKLQCMLGIFEQKVAGSTNGPLYITISESPGTGKDKNVPSDEFYMAKRKALFNLLKSANVRVLFDEPGSPLSSEPIIETNARWRRTPGVSKSNTNSDDDWNSIPEASSIKKQIIGNRLDEIMFLDKDFAKEDNIVNIYDRRIRNYPMTVHFVDSWDYLSRRQFIMEDGKSTGLYKGKTFKPFKKYAPFEKVEKNSSGAVIRKEKKWLAECNNGHLCTESKLFAYAHLHNIEPQSFVAYWIGAGVPPKHIIRGYCYRTETDEAELNKLTSGIEDASLKARITESYNQEISDEIRQLELLMIECRTPLKIALQVDDEYKRFWAEIAQQPSKNASNNLSRLEKESSKLNRTLERVVQPSAVVCPGCFANIQNYKDGKMEMWDGRNCYYPRNSVLKGGKTKKKRHTRKGKKGTRRSH